MDTSTGTGDVATTVDLDLDFTTDIAKFTELEVSYSFSQSSYDEFSEFDLKTHFMSAEVSHDFGDDEISLAYRYIDSRLDGADFLTLRQISPVFSRLFDKNWFLRAEYTYTEKIFSGRANRDADTQAGGADIYWFVDGTRRYFVAGYKYEDENALSDEFDFQAHNLKARFVQRIRLGGRDTQLRLGWRFEARDYASLTPSIDANRDDKRHRFQAEFEIPIVAMLYATMQYEYANFESNLPSADYSQELVSVQFSARF